ncbi:MAG TPA: hypothetical protein ENN73_01650 [Firmicutes bacterium]|nr:hypothetical protein [Bacillota bacterium]
MVFYEKMEHQKLGEILIEYNLISKEQLGDALKKQKELNLKLGATLIKLGLVTQDDINWVLHKQFNIPQITLSKDMVDLELIPLIPGDLFKENLLLPLSKSGSELTIVVGDPTDFDVLKSLEKSTGFSLNVCIADVNNIKNIKNEITMIISGEKERALTQLELVGEVIPQDIIIKIVEDVTGSLFFDFIFDLIISKNLDSLSIVPFENQLHIYFHFLGKHIKKFEIPIQKYQFIYSKAAQLWGLNEELTEGAYININYPVGKELRSFKVFVFKTSFGNAIKILQNRKMNKLVPLNKEGFSREQLDLIFSNLILEHGTYFILGKELSVSRNVLLSFIGEFAVFNRKIAYFDDFNIIDIEGIINLQDNFNCHRDPELPIPFIDSLSPDVICFSELITDKQISQAINLGYTGKTVIAFVRERDVFHFLLRILSLPVDAYILKNSLKLIIHHEKVEELCPKCKRPYTPNMDFISKFQNSKIEDTNFFRKVGCRECFGFGFTNLIDLYEVFKIDNFVKTNMENISTFDKMLKDFKSHGYMGVKTKILSLIAAGTIPFNSIIDIF